MTFLKIQQALKSDTVPRRISTVLQITLHVLLEPKPKTAEHSGAYLFWKGS